MGVTTDIEGNIYNTVTIGNQVWMVENLKTTKYNDGSDIVILDIDTDWNELDDYNIPGYCWYEYNIENKTKYGALYNWPAIESGKLCPLGWHIPTDEDWLELINLLGGEMKAGAFLKERMNAWMASDNTIPNNYSGFSALAGGTPLALLGTFGGIGERGQWWTSTVEKSPYDSYNYFLITRGMNYINPHVERYNSMEKAGGFLFAYLRCIKD